MTDESQQIEHQDRAALSRRTFLGSTARKAAYVAPFVAVLGSGSEALANSKDGIAWSNCGSQGENCAGGPCCPGYMCVSVMGMEQCQPDNCKNEGEPCGGSSECCINLTCNPGTGNCE